MAFLKLIFSLLSLALIDWSLYFPEPEDRRKFENDFLHRRIATPKVVTLAEIDALPCVTSLRVAKLDHFVEMVELAYPPMIKLFYANIFREPGFQPKFKTDVFGTIIEISPTLINSILGTSNSGIRVGAHDEFAKASGISEALAMRTVLQGGTLQNIPQTVHSTYTNVLGPNFVVLEEIIQKVICPRKGHTNEVSRLDIWLMACLTLQKKINWGYFICIQMIRACTHSVQALPYGMLITLILQRFNIQIPQEFEYLGITDSDYIDRASLKRKGWTQHTDGSWVPKPKKPRTDGASTSTAPPPPPPPPAISSEQFDQIMAGITSLSTSFSQRMDSMEEKLGSYGSAILDVQSKVASIQYSLQDLSEITDRIHEAVKPPADDDDFPGPDDDDDAGDQGIPALSTEDFDID